MKKLAFLLCIVLIFSCSKEDDGVTEETGKFEISGKFLAPNGLDPVVQAHVSLWKNNQQVKETKTDVEGIFLFENLQPGEYTVELNKGKFSSSKMVSIDSDDDGVENDLGNINIQILPKIGVVKGSYDNIESVLYDIGLVNPATGDPLFDIMDDWTLRPAGPQIHKDQHRHASVSTGRASVNPNLAPNVSYSFEDLLNDPTLMATYDIIFLNCGLDTDLTTNGNLYNYVNNGGIIYATDWAFEYLEEINTLAGNNYLTFLDPIHSGNSTSTDATILNPNLSNWLNTNFGIGANGIITIDEFLPAWQVVDTYDNMNVIPWLNGSVDYNTTAGSVVNDKDLAFTYQLGSGGIFYSSFHTENHEQGFSDVDRVMEYMVFELSTLSINTP